MHVDLAENERVLFISHFFFIAGKEVREFTLISSRVKGPCPAAWDAGNCWSASRSQVAISGCSPSSAPGGDGSINCKTVGGS